MEAGWLVFAAAVGACVGSFLTLLVDRRDSLSTAVFTRSRCDACGQQLSARDLIPVFSYLWLKGRCRHCRHRLKPEYLVFELIAAAAFAAVAATWPGEQWPALIVRLVAVSGWLYLAFFDWQTQQFPVKGIVVVTVLTVLSVGLESYLGVARPGLTITDTLFAWLETPQSAVASSGYGALVYLSVLGGLSVVSGGRWMGYGDAYIGVGLGIWLGYPVSIVGLVVAFYSGAAVAVWQILNRRVATDHRLAFGPFLIFGALIALVWGSDLLASLLRSWGVVV